MVQLLKNNMVSIFVGLLIVAFAAVIVAGSVYAAPTIENCIKEGSTLDVTSAGSNCGNQTLDGTTGINALIVSFINIFSIVVGVVAVIMLMYGGFRYITSGGDSGNVSNAKNTIIYAIVGLVIVFAAQGIVQFVLSKL